MKTFVPGKDAALEDTNSKIKSLLKKRGFEIEEISWLNPLPDVWSVHLRDKNCQLLCTNGKGTTKKAALASALGEFIERLSTGFFFSEYYLGERERYYSNEKFFPLSSKDFLIDELWEFYDPDGELKPENLVDVNSGDINKGICCLPFVSTKTGMEVFFPVNILNNLYVSNGMAAGNSESEAQSQALSEIIERYVKNKIISEGISLPEIPNDIFNQFPEVLNAREKLKECGLDILIKDASLGGKFPVINITLLNPKNGSCLAAFGAHPQFGIALERTLTELFQGRSLEQIGDFQSPSFDSGAVADYSNLESHFIDSGGIISWRFFNNKSDYEFQYWNFDGTTKQEVVFLEEIISKLGLEIFRADYILDGIYSCRIIIPGLSEIYPVDDLVWNNKNEGAVYREDILNLQNLDDNKKKNLIDKIENNNLNYNQLVCELIGLPVDEKSEWNDFRIGELKLLLTLSLGNKQKALDCFYEGFSTELFTEDKKNKYSCLKTMLEIILLPQYIIFDYEDNLIKLFGENVYSIANKMLSGNEVSGLLNPDFNMQKKLIDAYKKIISCSK